MFQFWCFNHARFPEFDPLSYWCRSHGSHFKQFRVPQGADWRRNQFGQCFFNPSNADKNEQELWKLCKFFSRFLHCEQIRTLVQNFLSDNSRFVVNAQILHKTSTISNWYFLGFGTLVSEAKIYSKVNFSTRRSRSSSQNLWVRSFLVGAFQRKMYLIVIVTCYFSPYMEYTRKIIHSVGSFFFFFFIWPKLPTLFILK